MDPSLWTRPLRICSQTQLSCSIWCRSQLTGPPRSLRPMTPSVMRRHPGLSISARNTSPKAQRDVAELSGLHQQDKAGRRMCYNFNIQKGCDLAPAGQMNACAASVCILHINAVQVWLASVSQGNGIHNLPCQILCPSRLWNQSLIQGPSAILYPIQPFRRSSSKESMVLTLHIWFSLQWFLGRQV